MAKPPLTLRPIGIIHTPFKQVEGTPIQPVFAPDTQGTVEILPEFLAGLKDLDGFERIWLIYHLHCSSPARMHLKPFLDDREHGVFATRAPCRPNPIGLSCVQLLSVRENTLDIGGVDIMDGTPLLDIKPYVPSFDSHSVSRGGWFDERRVRGTHADDRFSK
jgi:tRNA (adenine37-N6)-methyltransferase